MKEIDGGKVLSVTGEQYDSSIQPTDPTVNKWKNYELSFRVKSASPHAVPAVWFVNHREHISVDFQEDPEYLAMLFSQEATEAAHCWMRTLPKDIPSEFTVKTALLNLLRNNNGGFAISPIIRFIPAKQQNPNAIVENKRVA